MTLKEAASLRHSVRSYTGEPLSEADVAELNGFIAECNAESGLHMQLVTGEPNAFKTLLVKYGWFKNVENYVALVGKDDENLDELCGYYGEKVVLHAQQMGLGTCWVGGTFSRKKTTFEALEGERMCLIIAIGYPANPGKAHKNKKLEKLSNVSEDSPEWFKNGMEGVLLAPTAVNQQKFHFELLEDGSVKATASKGAFTKVDLGIAKYHFEIGAERKVF